MGPKKPATPAVQYPNRSISVLGGTDTAMWRRGKSAEYIKQALESGRIRPADFMRDVVLYLASAASRSVNGEIVSYHQRDWLAAR